MIGVLPALLIAQAVVERLSVVTADARFNEYDVPVVPAL